MKLTKKQQELDVMKWVKSQEIGADACGTFDYCVKCNKANENPCDKAYKAFNAKPAVKKTVAKKSATKKSAKACFARPPFSSSSSIEFLRPYPHRRARRRYAQALYFFYPYFSLIFATAFSTRSFF